MLETATLRFLVSGGTLLRNHAGRAQALSFDLDPQSLDFVVLAHAHAAIGELLPLLADDGFKGQIYGATDTFDLPERLRFASVCHRRMTLGDDMRQRDLHETAVTTQLPLQTRRIARNRTFAPRVGLRCTFRGLWPNRGSDAVELEVMEWGFVTRLLYLRVPVLPGDVAGRHSMPIGKTDIFIIDLGALSDTDPTWLLRWVDALQGAPSRVFVLHELPRHAATWAQQLHDLLGWRAEIAPPGHHELWPEFLAVP